MIEHYNIKVYGRVQGVGFRHNCYLEAKDIGLRGFVKNMPDGTVYIEAEGEDFQIERLLHWCKEGSPYARVEKVHSSKSEPENLPKFHIM